MALLTRNMLFLHIPHTGGTWVRKVMLEAFGPGREIGGKHVALQGVLVSRASLPNTVSPFYVLRNPVEWYRSYWAYRVKNGWNKEDTFDLSTNSMEFSGFIETVVEDWPGYLSRIYSRYIMGGSALRFEDLRKDLFAFVSRDLDERAKQTAKKIIYWEDPVNRSDPKLKESAVLPRSLVNALRESERPAMNLWGAATTLQQGTWTPHTVLRR